MSSSDSTVDVAAGVIDEPQTPPTPRGCDLRTLARLMRLPAVFTALADIFLGFLLTHAGIGAAPLVLGLLCATSACLYLSGMVWNDIFDRTIDAIERPERPIPSGRVRPGSATALASGLMAAGLVCAAALRWVDPILCGWNPLCIAGLIVLAIFLYDGLLKSTLAGPVSMGLCRFLNVLLGASASGFLFGRPFDNPQRWIATGLAVYVVGVTWFSRTEAQESRRSSLIGALVVVNAGLAILFGWIRFGAIAAPQHLALLLLAAVALSLNKRMLVAVSSPSPQAVQNAVRTLLLSIITLDASMIYAKTGQIALASVIAVALIVPALLTGRWIRMT